VLALTIRQPHASAILHLGKDVENRRWDTPHRGLVAIHAGKSLDGTAPPWMGEALESPLPLGHVIGVVELTDVVSHKSSKWARRDHFHWLLGNVRALSEPIPCRGQQGLWSLPPEVEERVISQL
jgi:hypothetical protein